MNIKDKKILIVVEKEQTQRKDLVDTLRCRDSVEEVFLDKGICVDTLYLEKKDFENLKNIKEKIYNSKADCVFNLFEGFSDDSAKEAEFAEILEEMQVPFTGNPSSTLGLCLDKERTKNILRESKILVPQGKFIKYLEELSVDSFNFPVFIKPCCEDASLGIDKDSLANTKEDLHRTVSKKIKEFPKGLLVEEFLAGKQYSAAFLGDFPYEALGISFIDYSLYKNLPSYFTYASKWDMSCDEFKILMPSVSKVDDDLKKTIIDIARKTAKTLGCRGYFRVDLRESRGELFVLDVNPNPDINCDSGFMKEAYVKGYTYAIAIEKILALALEK
ncbi:MAG: ATP-grasp domain-containing protein [Candidatus Omnitrophota bacterium]|nr:ATP-grasp domain-containing protein [Candidatus Omnitrophota bacterium]